MKNTTTNKQFECTETANKNNKAEFGISHKSERQNLKTELLRLLPTLPKHEVEDIRSIVHQHYVKRFRRSRIPKYGNLNKGFTEYEIQRFFKAIDNDKFRLLFSYQAQLGLRIGEVLRLNLKAINFQTRELTLKTEKARILDTLLIPTPLFKQTMEFIKANMPQIEQAKGYIFFKDCSSANSEVYLKTDYVRNKFREYIKLADIDQIYDISEESYKNHVPRRLHRLTTHSLRHYAITSFSKQTNGNVVLTSRFARHASPETTMIYISTKKEELYKELDNIDMDSVERLKRSIIKMERNST